ncbi:MAG: hypothetical protein JKY67_14950 [Pseudomonadales bacterium]|nr:hypothetical protein [Pseudomonadales bacterium]
MKSIGRPQFAIIAIVCCIWVLLAAMTHYRLQTPWLGLTVDSHSMEILTISPLGPLAKHDSVETLIGEKWVGLSSGGLRIKLLPLDFISDPDDIDSHEEFLEFFERQLLIFTIINEPQVSILLANSRNLTVHPLKSTPLSALPFEYWAIIVFAAIASVVASWLWLFSPDRYLAFVYLGCGLGYVALVLCNGIYSTREISLEPGFFKALSYMHVIGSIVYTSCGQAELWLYPKPFPRYPGLILIFLFGLLGVAVHSLPVLPLSSNWTVYWYGAAIIITASILIAQWRRTKGYPVERAAMIWLVLAGFFLLICFGGMVIWPNLYGGKPILGFAANWFYCLIIYVAVALSIVRYRLLDIERWAYTIFVLLISFSLLLGIDFLLVWWVNMNEVQSLALSLLIVGWLYFPLRQWFLVKISRQLQPADSRWVVADLIQHLLHSQTHRGVERQWEALLDRYFHPLDLAPTVLETTEGRITRNGLCFITPAFGSVVSYQLTGANKGSRLFTREDLYFLKSTAQLLDIIENYRLAFEHGVEQERKRTVRYLHDDIGSGLLSLIYKTQEPNTQDAARELLTELKALMTGIETTEEKIQAACQIWEAETRKRCDEFDIALNWSSDDNTHDLILVSCELINIRSILRETLSNIIKHSEATSVSIAIMLGDDSDLGQDEHHLTLTIDIIDDGKGMLVEKVQRRRGLHNMKARAEELEGNIDWISRPGEGCRVSLSLPLQGMYRSMHSSDRKFIKG